MFPYIMRRMVRVRNSAMSPEFQLNSLFHSVPVKGDYKLSKKNEILVDLFLNTLFHAVPPQSPLPPIRSFLPTKNQVCPFLSFFYFSLWAHQFPQSRGQVRGHLTPRCRVWATWQQRPPLLEICRSVPNFHLHPLPSSLSVKKTPAGMLHWGAVRAQSSEAAKFGCCHEESHTGNSSARKRWEIKGGDAPLLLLADKDAQRRRGNLYGHHFSPPLWHHRMGQGVFSKCV